jgi:hypothetical protein
MTPPTELVITEFFVFLPLPPNLANGRMHWRVKERKRKEYFVLCKILGKMGVPGAMHRFRGIEPAPGLAHLSFLLKLGNRMDDDNALARCKWAVDFLVADHILIDDSPKHCRMSIPSQVITRDKDKQRLEIHFQYQDSQ